MKGGDQLVTDAVHQVVSWLHFVAARDTVVAAIPHRREENTPPRNKDARLERRTL